MPPMGPKGEEEEKENIVLILTVYKIYYCHVIN
jgi:hypothetical protein